MNPNLEDTVRFVARLFFAAACLSPAAAAEQKPDDTLSKSAANDERNFLVPDGTPAELLAFIDKVSEYEAPSLDEKVRYPFLARQYGAVNAAADRILASEADDEQLRSAVESKFTALSVTSFVGGEADINAFRNIGKTLANNAHPAVQAEASHYGMLARIQTFLEGLWKLDAAQGRKVLTIDQLEYFKLLQELNHYADTAEIRYRDRLIVAGLLDLPLNDAQKLVTADVFRHFAKAFAISKDPRVSGYAKKIEGCVTRLSLVGNTLEISGNLVDGKPLDWSRYAGKTVLVEFWATWCGPCVQELPNVQKNYQKYHDRGFEVVSISCDDDRESLNKFIAEHKIAWPVLFESTHEGEGFLHPMVCKYGILGIPTGILVGADGRVISLATDGAQLGKELEKIYPEP